MPNKPPRPASTQEHLPLVGIEDGVIIVRDGSYRAVLAVGSTNFLLKSEQEQNALILAYQNFLNALNFPIQIVMQSRSLDLEPYLKKIEGTIANQANELVRQQTTDYVAYVRELISVANIMDKKFFVVVPYTPPQVVRKGLLSGIISRKAPAYLTIDEHEFQSHRDELTQRAGLIANGLSSLGLKATVLNTDEIVRLLYTVYNYDIAAEERLDNAAGLTETVISTQNPDEENRQDKPQPPTEAK